MLTQEQRAVYRSVRLAAGAAHDSIVVEINRLAAIDAPTPAEMRALRILRDRQKQFEPFVRNLWHQSTNGQPYDAPIMMPGDIAAFISDPLGIG